uniref:hypothetical protein n=1 Tax=Cocconeiopsis kantsiensis TaxID=3082010 RepID=UPI00300121BE
MDVTIKLPGYFMNKILIRITDTRLWILDYDFVCAMFFIPLTIYGSVKIKKIRINRKKKLEQERKIKELEKSYRILKIAGSSLAPIILLRILLIRGGSDIVVVPGIDDCIDISEPSYVDNERILRFVNDKYRKLAIKGIIYITKEALCYLVDKEGLVDFPVVFLERIQIDAFYSFLKRASQWAVVSVSIMAGVGGILTLEQAVVYGLLTVLHINQIKILEPRVKEVSKLTGDFVPRIATRRDAIVFDANKEPLPPVIEKSVKPVRFNTLDTEYEITEKNLVDVAKVSGLKNRFSDRRFMRRKKKAGKTVYFRDMVKKWNQQQDKDYDAGNIIDQMIDNGII